MQQLLAATGLLICCLCFFFFFLISCFPAGEGLKNRIPRSGIRSHKARLYNQNTLVRISRRSFLLPVQNHTSVDKLIFPFFLFFGGCKSAIDNDWPKPPPSPVFHDHALPLPCNFAIAFFLGVGAAPPTSLTVNPRGKYCGS